jgi:hypothetical protein
MGRKYTLVTQVSSLSFNHLNLTSISALNLRKPFLYIEMNAKMGLIHFFLRYLELIGPAGKLCLQLCPLL